uniref:Uncharacterized protein n=1 Tax=Meloidogyne enterolobii TaxID=390850 RepID=A0A6V7U995_MELEN|nr:unnamed protein product [Meloidogyne enterolobii]
MNPERSLFFEPSTGWANKTFIAVCKTEVPDPEVVQLRKDVEVLKTKVSELATRKEMLDLFAQMNSRLDSLSNNKISLLWQWFFGFLTVVALYFSIFKR